MLKIQQGRLIALRAPANVDPKKDPPTRLVMLKWGDNATTKGNFRVGPKTLAALAANQRKAGFDEVVLDFEHNTVPNHPSNRGEPAAIAARGKPLVVENEGLVVDSLSWTEPGKEFLEHYHDLSAVVAKDENDEVIFVHSAALCRNGATYDLHAFNAQLDLKTFALTTFTELAASPVVQVPASQIDIDLLRKVLSLSSLSSDATPEDINRALLALDQQNASGENDQATSALSSALRRTAIELATLSATVKNLKDGQMSAERKQILADATREGKIVPKQFREGGISNEQLRTLVAELPELVPMEKRTPEHIETLSVRVINASDDQVRRTLGISEEAWNKHPLPN